MSPKMSPKIKHFYEFCNFRLDTAEKILLHENKPVPLTPKVFDTLNILIENAGRLLEKDEMMNKIWHDHFVEESNLTFNIKMLRKALGDSATKPQFIETVPRRGYRFIAKVKKIAAEIEIKHIIETPDSEAEENHPVKQKSQVLRIAFVSFALLLLVVVAFGAWFIKGFNSDLSAPVLSAPFAAEKLSNNGRVGIAVITPDGKNVLYRNSGGDGKQSIWLRQLDSANNIEIIPPSDNTYFSLTTSPDGNFLYFTRRPRTEDRQSDIYRVSMFGGVPVKIISETQGWMSVSPDGEKISFVRCAYRDEEFCSLLIADTADGANEKTLVSRPRPFRISDNQFSPDGKSIAFAVGQSENGANEFILSEIDLLTGTEHQITGQKFFNIKSLAWLPGQDGLLFTASQSNDRTFRIWQFSNVNGDAQPITQDSETYASISLDKAAAKVVSIQVVRDFRLTVYQNDNPANPQVLADATAFSFAPDGKIYFSSVFTGSNEDIWSVGADGKGQRQLTNDAADDSTPVVAPDGDSIFFASNRSGEFHIWKIDTDGTNPKQVTQNKGGIPLSVSPDGKWIYYRSTIDKTLWRTTFDGSVEELVLDKRKQNFALSPDGLQIAYFEKTDETRFINIISLADKRIVKTIRLAEPEFRPIILKWSPDGKSLAYIVADKAFSHHILWFHFLDQELPQRIADLGDEEVSHFSLSPDGKTFAVIKGVWKQDAVLLKGLK
jgi:Tol biopolymer transport system component/DNA-binding winged helix-turn-helix (wHTH) protein